MKRCKMLTLIIFLTLSCFDQKTQHLNKEQSSKQLPSIEDVDGRGFIVRYSNVLITINEKKVKVPIYGGTYDEIEYEKLNIEKPFKNSYRLPLFVPAKQGHVNETYLNIINFYKINLLKKINTNNPTEIIRDGDICIISYQFENQGIPSTMSICFIIDYKRTDENIQKMGKNKLEYTFDTICLDEKQDSIGIQIITGKPIFIKP